MQRRCGPPPDRYRLGCAAPRGPKGVLYLCRPMASNSTLQRPTAQRRRRRRQNPQVCGGERGQPNWITGALGPGRRGLHARGSAKPALPCSSPIRLQAKYIVSQTSTTVTNACRYHGPRILRPPQRTVLQGQVLPRSFCEMAALDVILGGFQVFPWAPRLRIDSRVV